MPTAWSALRWVCCVRQEAGPPDENQLRLLRIGPDRRFEVIEVAITDQGLDVLR